jgi:hypothetical protein
MDKIYARYQQNFYFYVFNVPFIFAFQIIYTPQVKVINIDTCTCIIFRICKKLIIILKLIQSQSNSVMNFIEFFNLTTKVNNLTD